MRHQLNPARDAHVGYGRSRLTQCLVDWQKVLENGHRAEGYACQS